MRHLPTIAVCLLGTLAACGGSPSASRRDVAARAAPTAVPVALPSLRHGHRIERLAGGLLAFGGFDQRSTTEDRGTRETWFLPDGGRTWQRRADMATGRAFFGSAVVAGDAIAVGNGVERYDAAADRWVVLAPAGSLPRSHFAATAVDATLLVLGGFPAADTGMWTVDTATGAVRDAAPPPTFRPGDHFHLLCTIGGELHALGGLDGESFSPRREHFVLRDGAWVALPPPPVALWAKFSAYAVLGDRLFVFGDAGGHCWDAASGAWSERSAMPMMLAMPAAIAVPAATGDALWVIGGMVVDGAHQVLLRYDVSADRWDDLLAAK